MEKLCDLFTRARADVVGKAVVRSGAAAIQAVGGSVWYFQDSQ